MDLVGGWPSPLKNMSSSIGMIIPFPTEWENESHVPKHQPLCKSWWYILVINRLWSSELLCRTILAIENDPSHWGILVPPWGRLGDWAYHSWLRCKENHIFCVCMYVCLPACLPCWLAGWLSGCLSVWLSVCMYVTYSLFIFQWIPPFWGLCFSVYFLWGRGDFFLVVFSFGL